MCRQLQEEELHLLTDELDEVERRSHKHQRAAVEQLHVEEVSGERSQPPRLCVDDLEITAPLVRGKVALQKQRREAEH